MGDEYKNVLYNNISTQLLANNYTYNIFNNNIIMYIPEDIKKLIKSFCVKCNFCNQIKSYCDYKYIIEELNSKKIYCCRICFNKRTYPLINNKKTPCIVTYPNEK